MASAATLAVVFTGSAVRPIVAFVLHQMRSTDEPRDEFGAQLQVALKNSEAPDALLWTLLGLRRLASTWHEHKRRAWLNCAVLASAP